MDINRTMLYRRKREGRTNYKKRLIYLKGKLPRLVIRKTNQQMLIQLVNYAPDGDMIVTGIGSKALAKLGWKYSCSNIPAAYLAGLVAGKEAKAKGIKEAILDNGLQTNVAGSKVYAALQGVRDAGVNVPVGEEALPKKERLTGAHIANYYKIAKSNNQFSNYKKTGADPAKMQADLEALKKKIMG